MKQSIKSLLLFIVVSLFSVSNSLAQEQSVNCTVNQNPTNSGNRIQFTITLNNCKPKLGRLNGVNIEGLEFLGGPSVSQQSNSVNFQSATTVYSYTFQYRVVSQSDIKIPSFKIETNVGTKTTEPFTLKVQPKGTTNTSGNNYGKHAAVIEVSKKKVHIGEPVLITCKIYTRLNYRRYREELPDLEGFWKEELQVQQNNQSRTVVNGVEYIEHTISQILAFPQQTGEFQIDGFDTHGLEQLSFFNQREIKVNAKPVKINVLPLPQGKKENFIGTFGNLRLTAKTNIDSVATNEAFNYEVQYYGQGNLKLVQEPEILWPVEFEVFDPEIIDNIKVSGSGESGTRTFKYLIIPRAPGAYDLPNVSVSYFDYDSDKFVTRKTDGMSVKIFRDGDSENNSPIYSSKSDVTVINHDIRHISTDHGLWKHDGDNWGEKLIWIAFLLGPVIALLAFAGKRKRDGEANDLVGTRYKKAKSQLLKSLRVSSKAESFEAAYTIIGEALEEYLCCKLCIGRSAFNRAQAKKALIEQLGKEEAEAWDKLLQQCEMARYAPGAVSDPAKASEEIMKLATESDSKMKVINVSASAVALLLVLSPILSLAQTSPDTLFLQANEAYLSGDYSRAVGLYEEISERHHCFELEYNLGNAHYKLDNVGEAILHYERAKMIDPLNDDLRANMLLADLRAIDKIEELPGAGLDKILQVVFAGKLFSVWFLLGLGLWTIGFVLIAVRLKWKDSLLAPFARGGAATLIALSLVFISFALITHSRVAGTHKIVVMSDRIDVKSNPTTNSTDLFQLHEGARACIISEEAEWTEIHLDNGNVGWVLTSDVEGV